MLKIYVARHGQNIDNAHGILNGHRDEPLTALGMSQGHALAEGIKEAGLSFDFVYSSPLSRAYETARIVCETLGIREPRILDGLIERDFGVMTGKRIADIERLCAPDILKAEVITYFLSPPGAETFPQLMERARRVLEHVQAEHVDGTVLLVTHGDFGKMLYANFYRMGWEQVLTDFHFGNCELLQLVEGNSNVPHVIRVEQHNH